MNYSPQFYLTLILISDLRVIVLCDETQCTPQLPLRRKVESTTENMFGGS